jgi:L-seryl-tRNA(Ser) seleniumtransferase
MGIFDGGDAYEALGVRRLINAAGADTTKGGSILTQHSLDLMADANRNWVDMPELLRNAGAHIAGLLGVEAAHVTSGAASALTLSAAACMAGNDKQKMGQLPDTTGMKDEVVVLAAHDYIFARCLTYAGGKLVRVGDESGCTIEQIEAAVGPNTAAVEYYVGYTGDADVPTLQQTVDAAHRQGVPLIADAAAVIYPLDRFVTTARAADLVCFGGKYVGGPNAGGYVCGRKDLIDAVVANGFIEFHGDGQGLGRGMKMDRGQIVALVSAVDSWLTTNHEDRLADIERRLVRMNDALSQLSVFDGEIVERFPFYFGYSLRAKIDVEAVGKTVPQMADDLYEEDPRIWILPLDDETVELNVYALNDGEDEIVIDRVTAALTT